MRRLDQSTFVAVRQLTPADVDEAAAAGIRLIVNNRPDGEEPGQPSSGEIDSAALAAGLSYRHVPVAGGFPSAAIEAMADALDHGPALLFCRSGTRSTYLWALARASRGAEPETLLRQSAEAGYDLRPLLPLLTRRGADGP
jgi:uncharacterized protein (TIGR01244 family)